MLYDHFCDMATALPPDHQRHYDESAFEWHRRSQRNRRRLRMSPLYFPALSPSAHDCDVTHGPAPTTEYDVDGRVNVDGTPSSYHLRASSSSVTVDRITVVVRPEIMEEGAAKPFWVSRENVRMMAASTFFCERDGWNDLSERLDRWRRRRNHNRRIRCGSNLAFDKEEGEDINSLEPTDTISVEGLEDALLDSFPTGTGITFIDRILSSSSLQSSLQSSLSKGISNPTDSKIVMEITGRSGTAKTHVLMSLAANYVASTSTYFLESHLTDCNLDPSPSPTPIVVILDPEYAIHTDRLESIVRAAVIRRWNATENYRTLISTLPPTPTPTHQIEHEVTNALGRVHIIHPRGTAYGYVAALESLRATLDRLYQLTPDDGHPQFPPNPTPDRTLLLLDSVSNAFEPMERMLEALPDGAGLSGRNEFLRQLHRSRVRYPVSVVWTHRTGARGLEKGGIVRWLRTV